MADTPISPPERPRSRGWILWGAFAAALVVVLTVAVTMLLSPQAVPGGPAASEPSAPASEVPEVPTATIADLPPVRYDAVIEDLVPFTGDASDVEGRFALETDAAIFGADRRTPVARFPATDFLGEQSTVVVVGTDGPWSLVLTPARVTLPSESGGSAPAQSAGWVAASALQRIASLDDEILISTGAQTLTIQRAGADDVTFDVGVGTPSTPTPTDVTGYLQQRYLDPAQGAAVYPIQLTSLHSAAQDEPLWGDDGGLIGIHFNPQNSGAVSHGCVRLSEEAIEAVNSLPLGTPVTIVD